VKGDSGCSGVARGPSTAFIGADPWQSQVETHRMSGVVKATRPAREASVDTFRCTQKDWSR
jgi:hypothetical protein